MNAMDAETALERIDVIYVEQNTENKDNTVGTKENVAETVDDLLIAHFLFRICRISN